MEDSTAVQGFTDQLRGLEKQLQKAIRRHCRLMGQTFATKARGNWTPPRRIVMGDQPVMQASGIRTHAGLEVLATVEEGGGTRDIDGEIAPATSGTALRTPAARQA